MKILVTDDNPLVIHMLEVCLGRWGHTVLASESGEEALALLEREQGIGMVIADVNMRGMSGLDMLPRIRQSHPSVMIWLVSGAVEPNTAISAIRRGADKIVSKLDLTRELGRDLAIA